MQSSVHKARDLSPEVRRTVEALLGRVLREDESVSVRAFKGNLMKEAPTGVQRKDAFRRLFDRIDKTAKRGEGVPDREINAAIYEAADHVHHHRS